MDLESLIPQVKEEMGRIIQKPKMADKLLSRPPFRFLHDVISAVTAATGFADGLYSGDELDSGSISDKHAKMDYLSKMAMMLGICEGENLNLDPLKVVQGLECENTNMFLLTLARCAGNPNIDSRAAVSRTLNGEKPGEGPRPLVKGGGDAPDDTAVSKSEAPFVENQSKMGNMFDDARGSGLDEKGYESKGVVDAALEPNNMGERGKSRGGTRGGKPTQQTGAGAGLTVGSSRPAFIDNEIERCDGNTELTKELVGALIQRPKMADKLLGRPPFRFLHDTITEIVKATGFGTGLYDDLEMDSANISDKEKKVNFLQKIINLVGLHLNTIVEAKPGKIVAGQEATSTNQFLQLLALCATHMPDSTESVRSTLESMGLSAPTQSDAPMSHQPQAEEKKRAPREHVENFPSSQPEEAPQLQDYARREDAKPSLDDASDMKGVDNNFGEANTEVKRSLRPTTARRRPPKVQDGSKEVESKTVAPVATKTEGILVDGQDDDDDDIVEEIPGSKIVDDGPVDTADAKESKLVQDILGRQAEQEIASKPEAGDGAKETTTGKTSTGIKLGRLRKTGLDKKSSNSSTAAPTTNAGDIDHIRKAVQTLVQHTGPLGTCMDYIQEDISLMTTELHRWEEECQKYEVEMEQQKLKTQDTLKPLYSELNDLEEQVKDKVSKISGAKAAISKNEERIQQILKLVATS